MKKLVLIDGHSILNRAFYGVPILTNSEGLHTNAVYGFLNILFKVLEEEKAEYLAVAFDLKAPTFRHVLYGAYKGTRKPMPEELREQVPLMKEILTAMRIPLLTKEGYEADDLLGTIAKREQAEGYEVTILSGDRDLLQLADDHIKISLPKTSKGTTTVHTYYPEDVMREYQVSPKEFIEVKALMGDASDNIPGVPSIGEKTATNLIGQYKSLENLYAHLDEVKPPRAKKALQEHKDLADLSLTLARICLDAPVDFSIKEAKIGNLYTPEAFAYMKRLELKTIAARFGNEIRQEAGTEIRVVSVTDFADAERIFEKAGKADRIGMELFTENSKVIALGLCMDPEESYVIFPGGFLTESYLCGKYQELCKCRKTWVIDFKHALSFTDLSYENQVFDAGVAAYLLNPLKASYPYDEIARDFLGINLPGRIDLIGKDSFLTACEKNPDAFLKMAGFAAACAYLAGGTLPEKLRTSGMEKLYLEIELPLIYTLHQMEKTGIKVEKEALSAYGEKLTEKIEVLEKKIWDLAGETFNINSPKQLGEILFEKMGIKGGKKTKTGYSTAADILEKLAPEYPLIEKILDYRQYTKLNSTYAQGLGNYIREDGRIHSNFNQTITATGRISSTEPNLQNIPIRMELGREIRKVFVPEDGFAFVDADYSQIELRVLAHLSGDENLIAAYQSAQDIHAITASQVFHIPLEEVTPLQRRNAKAVNFGIVYGISAFGLSEDLSISRKEAGEYINRYFDTYPGVKTFLDDLVTKAKESGYITTMFGRRRPVPELKSSNFMQRSFGERVAMNSPIQGTAADIIKIAMIRVDQRLKKEGLRSRLILQVHDELLIEAAEEELDEVKRILAEEMHHAADLRVELEIDMHEGKNWFEAK